MIEFGARLTLQDQMSATLLRNIQAQRQFQEAIDSTRSSLEQMTGEIIVQMLTLIPQRLSNR